MRFWSTSDSTSESILDKLEAIYLCLVEIAVERVTVVKFRMEFNGLWKWQWWMPSVLKSIKGRMRRRSQM
jgi:hypothetical protein